jgi:hypothetical protein
VKTGSDIQKLIGRGIHRHTDTETYTSRWSRKPTSTWELADHKEKRKLIPLDCKLLTIQLLETKLSLFLSTTDIKESSYSCMSIIVAARSKTWTVFVRSNTGIVGSNPTRVMHVCVRLFCVCSALRADSGLATGLPTSQESYRLCKKIKKLKNRPWSKTWR